MRLRTPLIAGAALLVIALAGASPALASFGAIAYDQTTGKFGVAWSEPTQQVANEKALRDCGGSKNCHAFPIPPGQCGALAVSSEIKESSAWGGAYRDAKAEAEAAATTDCKKHTAGQCKVVASECNR